MANGIEGTVIAISLLRKIPIIKKLTILMPKNVQTIAQLPSFHTLAK